MFVFEVSFINDGGCAMSLFGQMKIYLKSYTVVPAIIYGAHHV